jgi:septal ring factor EnvC (AmiA/AmiB activator)
MARVESRNRVGLSARAAIGVFAISTALLSPVGLPRLAADDTAAPATQAARPAAIPASQPDTSDPKLRQREESQRELQAIEQSIKQSDEERQRIEAEIASIKADREKLQQALVAAAEKVRGLEDRISNAEDRLAKQVTQERALNASLQSRRELIGHVLGALQRIGSKPPPAVIVSAQDILVAVRASIALGAVLPELREETRALANDLTELARLRDGITTERDGLKRDLAELGGEHARLSALVNARQTSLAADEKALGDAGKRATALAERAKGMRDFLAGIDADISQREKRAAEERKAAEALALSTQNSFTAASLKEPTRLSPKIAFADARGLLPLPVSGSVTRDFGDPNDAGQAKGVSISTRPGAIVSSPSEGIVAHAGPFKGYGQLLIINAGSGYHIVLAGLGHINVAAGQAVLAGEPLGEMGESNVLTTEVANTTSDGPILYVEFRKDGSAINPGPWWAKTDQRKVRG